MYELVHRLLWIPVRDVFTTSKLYFPQKLQENEKLFGFLMLASS